MKRTTCYAHNDRIGVIDNLLFRLTHGGQRPLRCWRARARRR